MRKLLLMLFLLSSVVLWGCSSSDDDGPTGPSTEDQAAADNASTEAMGDLMEDMEEVMGEDFDPDDIDALMDMDMDPYTEGFEAALALDPNCGPAHFGLAFVEMLTMAQQTEIQDIIDEFGDELGGLGLPLGVPVPAFSTGNLLSGGLMGRSFEILRRSPLALSPQQIELGRMNADKADGPLIRNLQTHIHDVTLPATASIVGHLAAAENDPDFSIIIISGDAPDTVEIDLGEVYILDAVVRALRSGLQIATAYDIELAPDGDYTWITDSFTSIGYTDYNVVDGGPGTDTLYLEEDEEVGILRQAQLMNDFEDLLAPGGYFLTLWTDPWSGETAMEAAYTEIQTLLVKLEAAYVFIQAEGDNQDHDLISQMLLAELDQAIMDMSAELPEYLGTWETIPDIIAWIEEILAGPYTVPVEISDTETFDLTVNISALFLTPVEDWKTKLPYMDWLPVDEWAWFDEIDENGPYGWNSDVPYSVLINGEEMTFENIGTYYITEIEWDTSTQIIFLDGPDGQDILGEFFYFPDYTFGGLFPDMDRDGWLTLMGEV